MKWSEEEINDFYSVVGNKIKEARIRQKITQTDLAIALGLTRSSIANIEAGRQRVQLHGLVQMAIVLNLHVGDLIHTPEYGRNNLVEIHGIDEQPATTVDFLSAVARRAGSA
ncbi:helix-turn-helix domain-containing protein [Amycolatopsis sp. NPDC004378]